LIRMLSPYSLRNSSARLFRDLSNKSSLKGSSSSGVMSLLTMSSPESVSSSGQPFSSAMLWWIIIKRGGNWVKNYRLMLSCISCVARVILSDQRFLIYLIRWDFVCVHCKCRCSDDATQKSQKNDSIHFENLII
jgi:hypothetical protein